MGGGCYGAGMRSRSTAKSKSKASPPRWAFVPKGPKNNLRLVAVDAEKLWAEREQARKRGDTNSGPSLGERDDLDDALMSAFTAAVKRAKRRP